MPATLSKWGFWDVRVEIKPQKMKWNSHELYLHDNYYSCCDNGYAVNFERGRRKQNLVVATYGRLISWGVLPNQPNLWRVL